MKEEMILQIRVFGEPSGTDVTFEGPRPRMDVHVRSEIAWGWERFAAQVAFVWLILEKINSVTY